MRAGIRLIRRRRLHVLFQEFDHVLKLVSIAHVEGYQRSMRLQDGFLQLLRPGLLELECVPLPGFIDTCL